MKRTGIAGFIFGCFAPLLLFGIALQGPALLGKIAQKFIEFTYVGVHFFGEAFGLLNPLQRILVICSGGILWAVIFIFLRYFKMAINHLK